METVQKPRKSLRAKDLVTTGIFTALMIIVIFIFAMLLRGVPLLSLFTTSFQALAAGTIFLYLVVKTGKSGPVAIMSVLVGVFMFIAGHFWPCLVFGLVFGLAADFLCGRGGRRVFWWNAAGYAAFIMGLTLNAYTPMLFFADAFRSTRSQMGMDAGYIEKFIALTRGPLMIASIGAALVCSFAGALAGKVLLRRHFEKAGLL